jgi:hypothetical protein
VTPYGPFRCESVMRGGNVVRSEGLQDLRALSAGSS